MSSLSSIVSDVRSDNRSTRENARRGILQFIKNRRKDQGFVDRAIPFTPSTLLNDMLANIEELNMSKSICVVNTVEWAIDLYAKGYNNITLATDASDPAIELIATLFGFGFMDNILKKEYNVKFDVVIGNPPFQEAGRADAANKLWPHIVKKGWDLLKDNGTLGMITPDSWKSPSADAGKGTSGFSLYKDIMKKYNVRALCCDSAYIQNEHFKGVGSSFSWFVIEKTDPTMLTKLVLKDRTELLNIAELDTLPNDVSGISISINNKMASNRTFEFIDNNSGQHGHESKTQSAKFCHINYHTPAKGGTFIYSDKKDANADSIKVMLSLSGTWAPRIDLGTMGAGYFCISKVVTTEDEAVNLQGILNSKLFSYSIASNRYSGFLPRVHILGLPFVDYTRPWTDEELYAHFNLTQEEIEYVESTVK